MLLYEKRYSMVFVSIIFLLLLIFVLFNNADFSKAESNSAYSLLIFESNGEEYQPIAIKHDCPIDVSNIDQYVSHTGAVSAELWPFVHSMLIDERSIIAMDTDTQRIILLLADNEGVIARIAVWDHERQCYNTIDSPCLPRESFLDSYHDGNAVFIHSMNTKMTSFYLTFECYDQDWILTYFNNGYTIWASKEGNGYILNDYYVPSDQTAMIKEGIISFSDFNIQEIDDWFQEYDRVFPDHPSLK